MEGDQKKSFKAGSYIYIEGDEDVDEVYLVEKGEVHLEGADTRLLGDHGKLHPGDVFGFVSSLSRRPRIESARVVTEATIIVFNRENFLDLLSRNARVAMKLINHFANQLRYYDKMIFSRLAGSEEATAETNLHELANYYFGTGDYHIASYVLARYTQLFPQGEHLGVVRDMLTRIESTDARILTEPIRDGVFLRYADRQVIFCEDEPGNALYVVVEGKIKIVKFENGVELLLTVLEQGDLFGELAIVSDKPRNATAISFGASRLLPVTRESLPDILVKSPDMLKKIFVSISQRIWFTFARIESKFYSKPLTRIYVFLENKLREENVSLRSGEPFVINFGIDELMKMVQVNQKNLGPAMNQLLDDHNLQFQMGQITILSPAEIAARAKYHKTRDNLGDS